MFRCSWDLLQDIKSSTDLKLCFSGIYLCLLSKVGSWCVPHGSAKSGRSVPGVLAGFAGNSVGKASAWSLQSFA